MKTVRAEQKTIRLVFSLDFADNPRLYEELARFAQGPKRVNRLRVLAYDGLLAQHGAFSVKEQKSGPAASLDETPVTTLTNGLFEAPLKD